MFPVTGKTQGFWLLAWGSPITRSFASSGAAFPGPPSYRMWRVYYSLNVCVPPTLMSVLKPSSLYDGIRKRGTCQTGLMAL